MPVRATIGVVKSSSSVRVSEQRFVLVEEALADLADRLASPRLPADRGSTWERGLPIGWLRGLLDAWREFDAAGLHQRLDGLRQLRVDVGGQIVHVVVADGRGVHPLPVLLTHGWPGSFLEFLELVSLLCDPEAHGENTDDTFTVIVPSLPGFGFSGPPPSAGMTGRQVTALWHPLMGDGMGHASDVAHGSDLGAGVTAWLAQDHPEAVRAS